MLFVRLTTFFRISFGFLLLINIPGHSKDSSIHLSNLIWHWFASSLIDCPTINTLRSVSEEKSQGSELLPLPFFFKWVASFSDHHSICAMLPYVSHRTFSRLHIKLQDQLWRKKSCNGRYLGTWLVRIDFICQVESLLDSKQSQLTFSTFCLLLCPWFNRSAFSKFYLEKQFFSISVFLRSDSDLSR